MEMWEVYEMPKMRTEVQHLEAQVQSGNKRFVRYAEGAALYSLGLHTFQEIAKEANAVYKVKRCVLVNLDIVNEYLERHRVKKGEFGSDERNL